MPVTVKIAQSGAAILEALRQVSPTEAAEFEREYRQALSAAAQSLDTAQAERVLNRWWGIAHLRHNPTTAEEADLIRRLDAGEDVGLPSPQRLGAN